MAKNGFPADLIRPAEALEEGWRCLRTPYNAAFVRDLKDAVDYRLRCWDADDKVWWIAPEVEATVARLVRRHYTTVEAAGMTIGYSMACGLLRVKPGFPVELVSDVADALCQRAVLPIHCEHYRAAARLLEQLEDEQCLR